MGGVWRDRRVTEKGKGHGCFKKIGASNGHSAK